MPPLSFSALQIAQARTEGQRVIGEAVASGLVLDESAMWDDANFVSAAKFVMSPPIRRLTVDGVALQGALANGALQLVGTDHCAFNSTQKGAGRCVRATLPRLRAVQHRNERPAVSVRNTSLTRCSLSPRKFLPTTPFHPFHPPETTFAPFPTA